MSKVWLANLHLGCSGTGQLLLHVIFLAVSLKEPGVDVTWWAFAALLHHQLWIHKLQASQCFMHAELAPDLGSDSTGNCTQPCHSWKYADYSFKHAGLIHGSMYLA